MNNFSGFRWEGFHRVGFHCVLFLVLLAGCGPDAEQERYEQLRKKALQSEQNQLDTQLDFSESTKELRRLFGLGEYERASQLAREMMLARPNDAETLVWAARSLHALGETKSAIELLDSVDTASERFGTEAPLLAAEWIAKAGEYELAIERFTTHVREFPEQVRSRRRLAELLNNSGRRMDAAVHLRCLLEAGVASEKELFAMLNLGEAFIDESLPPPSGLLTMTSLGRARRFRDEGKVVDAIALTQRLNEKFPNHAAIQAFYAKLLAESQQYAQVVALSQSANDALVDQPEYWFALGSSILGRSRSQEFAKKSGSGSGTGDFTVAIRCFAEAISRDRTDSSSVLGLARALKLEGKANASERAMECFSWLDQTHQLMGSLGKTRGTPQQYNQMSRALTKLGRLTEAAAWQRLSLGSVAGKSPTVARDLPPLATRGLEYAEFSLPQLAAGPSNLGNAPSGPSRDNRIDLHSVSADVGLDFQYDNGDDLSDDQFFLHQQTGGGIGVIDFDRDGWPDLYFAQAGGRPFEATDSGPNQLYRNMNGKRFNTLGSDTDTGDLGYGQGVDVADINQDGFADLLIANIGPNRLLLNNGDGTFTSQELPDDSDGLWTTSIASGDLDGNGLPEIVEVNYIDDETALAIACVSHNDACGPSRFQPATDRWLTVGDQGDLQIWPLRPRSGPAGHGFAIAISDFDHAKGNEVYVANDGDANMFFHRADQLTDTPNSTIHSDFLIETGFLSGCAASLRGGRHGSMGLACGDLDGNGLVDFHVTNYWDQDAELYLQRSPGLFDDSSTGWGLDAASKPTVGWGTQASDFDRDGNLDLAVLNGHIVNHSNRGVPFKMLPQLFHSSGDGFDLVENFEPDNSFWSRPSLGRTLAKIDFNRDGMPDLIANHLDRPVDLLENRTSIPGQHWLQLELVGVKSERDAVGATVRLRAGTDQWVCSQLGGGGFLCANEALIDFGVAEHERIDEIEVTWPSGEQQTFRSMDTNQRLLIVEGYSWSQIGR